MKDPSSRLLRWRLRLEEYKYEIEYVKGKENKVADYLSRLSPTQTIDLLQQAADLAGITVKNIEREPHNSKTSSETTSNTSNQQDLYGEFTNWKLAPILGKVKTRPNAIGKLWKHITKEELPPFDKEDWLRKLGWFIDELENKKLTIIRLSFYDPLITPIEKETIQEMLEFL